MTNKLRRQFSFLPYVALQNEVKIGNAIFWSFHKKKDEHIKNAVVKQQLENFLQQYVMYTRDRTPLKDITIVSFKSPSNLKPLTKNEIAQLKNAVTCLCFSTLTRNKGWSAFSSDDFQLIHQNFILGSDDIALSSGSIIRRGHGGLKTDEVLFILPPHIAHGFPIDYNKDILEALAKLQADKTKENVFRRIINSLEWVSYSYTNVDNFNYSSRIVMLSTAFEILLDGFSDRTVFINKTKPLVCNSLDNSRRMRARKEVWWKGKKQTIDLSLKEWFVFELYDLRSRIVHGNRILAKDLLNKYGKPYFLLGIKFFEECLKRVLEKEGCFPYGFGDKVQWCSIYDEIRNKKR